MADKKITALTSVSNSDIGGDDLLHIVDNPGGTPVNKKMTINQLFENIPTFLASDDLTTYTGNASADLNTEFTTLFDLNAAASSTTATGTLGNGSNTGQLKIIGMTTAPSSSSSAVITVTNFGTTATGTNQLTFNALGEFVLLFWNGSKWYVVANYNATVA